MSAIGGHYGMPLVIEIQLSTNDGFILFFLEILQILMRAISSPPFRNYNVWWSLSDSKYAGTALFIKKCFQPQKVSFSLDQTGSFDT